MLATLARVSALSALWQKLDSLRHQGAFLAAAALIGFVAVLFLLDAVRLGLAVWMPIWAATLVVAIALLIGAWILSMMAKRGGRRQRMGTGGGLAMPAVLPFLESLKPQISGLFRRHGMELILGAVVALGIFARSRSKNGD